ncbi:hypothetical protein M514_24305 [Trichuris suis]|uniref:Uncharacterized protein n=1 Tax=Trichuris suis TaxID=68888 RepID=A0A085N200_9BILA|nr:hypothetical protein M514_24305 [Trichuris suis]
MPAAHHKTNDMNLCSITFLTKFSLMLFTNECNKTCIDMWLACNNEAGFHILNDDEIIAAVSNLHREPDEEEE